MRSDIGILLRIERERMGRGERMGQGRVMGDLPLLTFDSTRPFGAEIELNALDGRDRPEVEGRLPEGIDHVGHLLAQHTKSYVEIRKWGRTDHNSCWVVKPDGSCGIEVCSPVYRGLFGIGRVCDVIDLLAQDPLIEADSRCSLHVHAGVEDLSNEAVGTVLAWWIKCEASLLDAMPNRRKLNNFCRQIGLTDKFSHELDVGPYELVAALGASKYWTANTYHLVDGSRRTMEFRIMDEGGCIQRENAWNWTIFCLHFIERAVARGWPRPFADGDPWTSLLWLDPEDVWRFLGFAGQLRLCPVLSGVRDWLIQRWVRGGGDRRMLGPWCEESRRAASAEVSRLVNGEVADGKAARKSDLSGVS
jgi:hypothetical protein